MTASVQRGGQPAARLSLQQFAWVVLAVSFAALVSVIAVPLGFRGQDDYQYLIAAEQWLTSPPVVGANHWANRLPYIFAIVASHELFGSWEVALFALHSLAFICAATMLWVIARYSLESADAAWFGLAVFCATPLLLRMPSTFYPEPLEIALATVPTFIVLSRDRWSERPRLTWLFLAGLIGGLVLSIRQTAIAVPASLALLMLLDRSSPMSERLRGIGALAAGYSIPVLAELVYYWALTGNPFHRLTVDVKHVEFGSSHLRGETYDSSKGILFNWDLASRWTRESLIESHWSITALVRLFTSPGLLFVPWFACIGGVIAWKRGVRERSLVILVLSMLLIQYVLNTFVFVLPPNTRYFSLSLGMLCILAGVALASIRPRILALGLYAALFVAPCLGAMLLQPRGILTTRTVGRIASRSPERLYLMGELSKVEAAQLRDDPQLASKVSLEPAPPGGLSAGLVFDRPSDWGRTCADGRPAYAIAGNELPQSWLWTLSDSVGLDRLLPKRLVALVRGDASEVLLIRRSC